MGELDGKTILISGVGPGLGHDIAQIALREGAKVVAGARQIERLRGICAELDPSGERIAALQCDITDAASCTKLIDGALARFGRLDGVVHVAAHDTAFGGLEGADLAEWRMIYDINVFGTLQLTQAALPALRVNGGSIAMIGSQSTDLPQVLQMAYASSKAALRNLGKQLAVELGPDKIRVNTVVATWMWGPAVQGYVAGVAAQRGVDQQVVIDEITSKMPLGQIPEDGDVAEMVVFLMSDRARVVTGQAIFVNAGEFIN